MSFGEVKSALEHLDCPKSSALDRRRRVLNLRTTPVREPTAERFWAVDEDISCAAASGGVEAMVPSAKSAPDIRSLDVLRSGRI
jgi:hypothetical protein